MNQGKTRTAISPVREQDFPEWYQQVIKAAELAENSPVRGCMVIRPWGYGLWERMQKHLDQKIKDTGHDNAYFPLFIPLSFLEREAEHVEGFAKECAVVTHHRLEAKDGKLVPAGELEEPLVVRPTSETIVGDCFSRWVESHRDLPLKINQWANVVRWEMRPRLFLRTAEFLWQEGHTAHATEEEAKEETLMILELYRSFVEDVLAVPVIVGEKSPAERFPGAENTYSMEAMMQDRKALQMGTSHYLGQNFSKACKIQFTNKNGELEHAYTTSWGVTTRMIGSVIMVHGDDDGVRLPPRIAAKQVVILPVIPKEELREQVLAYAHKVAEEIRQSSFHGESVLVHVDDRDLRGGEKNWQWIKKGIPLRIEVGPRDMENDAVMLFRRDKAHKDRLSLKREELAQKVPEILQEMQDYYFRQAKAWRSEHIYEDITDLAELETFFTPKNSKKPEIHGGFVRAKWCGEAGTEEELDKLKLAIRCIPIEQSGTQGTCIITGKPATTDVIIAKSY
ncbi:MAG: proline--tRNA ligase [Waddliaceae bacterium]|nr:proline--tRNA ligase [Waddliaceae bacterium]